MMEQDENHQHETTNERGTTRSLVTMKGGPTRAINVQKDLYHRPSTLDMTDTDLVDDLESAAEYVKLLTVPYVPESEGRIVKYFHEISCEEHGILSPRDSIGMALFSPLKAVFQFAKHAACRLFRTPMNKADEHQSMPSGIMLLPYNTRMPNPMILSLRKSIKMEAARLGANCVINVKWQESIVPFKSSIGIRTTIVGDAVLIERRSDIEERNKAEKNELQADKDDAGVERGLQGLGIYGEQ